MPRVQRRSEKSEISVKSTVAKNKHQVKTKVEPVVEDIEDDEDEDEVIEETTSVANLSSAEKVSFEDDKPRTKLYNFVFAVVGGLLTATILLACYFIFKPSSASATEQQQVIVGELHFDQDSYNNAKALIDYYKEVNTERGAFISNADGDVYLVVGDHSYRILSNDETAELLAVSDDGDIEDVSDMIDEGDGEVSSTVADDGKSIIYHIKWGDTLCQISSKYDQPITDIAKLNGIKNVHLIYAGNDMKIPTGKTKMTPEEIEADNKKYHQQWLDMHKK